MTDIDWGYACLSLMAAVTMGLAVGLAAHWAVGTALSIGTFLVLAVTEGFKSIPDVPQGMQQDAESLQ
ncbi:hypothetical protein [Azohydromonas australica]|uniref:hypothetical protein n=1 Tax=Azohydromonas australica TaxID=364039 RepID=UPI00042201DF|nr:hypothetical protein [Azohydromonas australica]